MFIESSIRRKKRQLENQPFKAEIVNKKERKSLEFILIRLLKTGKKGKTNFFVNCSENKLFVRLGDLVGSRCVFENAEGEGEIVQGKDES